MDEYEVIDADTKRRLGRFIDLKSARNMAHALEDRRYAAMCSGDFGALEAMLHDELLYTHSSGLTDTKATWLASLRSGKTKYKSAVCGLPRPATRGRR